MTYLAQLSQLSRVAFTLAVFRHFRGQAPHLAQASRASSCDSSGPAGAGAPKGAFQVGFSGISGRAAGLWGRRGRGCALTRYPRCPLQVKSHVGASGKGRGGLCNE